jgi:serine/threonine protein phosphatase PrpC
VIGFFRRVFRRKSTGASNIQTAPLSGEQIKAVTKKEITLMPPQLVVGIGESVGKQRDHNEDTLFVLNATLAGTSEGIPFGIFLVADGMGGHQFGEVASGIAARTMAGYLVQKLYYPFFSPKPEPQAESFQEIMRNAVLEAQQAVIKQVPGGGTTLTAVFVLGEQATLAHVGDSRAYLIYPDGRMQAITRDHSLVKRLIELGQITEKEAYVHPQRNVLYRAVGQGEPFEPDVSTFPLPHPGYLMLCTDGLWGVLPELEIYRIINNASNPSMACHELVEAANAAGGPDNISVILAYYPN